VIDDEDALCTALEVVTERTGTPAPKRPAVPPEIRLLRVPGGPSSTPWQEILQVEITHYGASRAQARELALGTEAVLNGLNPSGGTLAGVFYDRAERVADGVYVADTNEDIRPVVTVWRLVRRK
jgi:hypothetical protein